MITGKKFEPQHEMQHPAGSGSRGDLDCSDVTPTLSFIVQKNRRFEVI